MPEERRLDVVNTATWIKDNESSFLPPVCNKLMHNEQLLIMFVGGPNNREDYHLEEGEELFYQVKGDMCLKILENNIHKDVVIKEGEFFLLPARVPHSPQRTANSCGLVIERRRKLDETDGVRWFVPGKTEVLYEKWFYCKNLGKDLIPVIQDYFSSEEYKTKTPGSNVVEKSKLPFKLNPVSLDKSKHGPYEFISSIETNSNEIIDLSPPELELQFQVLVFKQGKHTFKAIEGVDHWFWQLKGKSKINLDEIPYDLIDKDSIHVPTNHCKAINIDVSADSFILKVTQNPELKRVVEH